MENIHEHLEQSEKTIVFLQEQLAILTALAAQKQQSSEDEEIKRISAENEHLRKDLIKLKGDLRYYEVQNGVSQIALPKPSVSCSMSNDVETVAKAKVESLEKPVQEQKAKEPKKNKNNDTKGKAKQASADTGRPIDAARLNMKIGKVVDVKKHPDADGLYVEDVDLGEGKNRTIVSGLVKHYALDQIQGKVAVFLCNLKPAKMRGILSEGMIMCASSPEKVEILQVPDGAEIGDRVVCEGYGGEPDEQLNPKKKIWEQIQPDLNVGADGIPGYKGGAFTIVGKGVCTAPSMRNCMVK